MNTRAGSALSPAAVDQAAHRAQLAAEILEMPAVGAAEWMARIASRSEVVVAAGGDGTASLAASAVLGRDRTLGVIPCGTRNHFARDAGIPAALETAMATVAAGFTRLIDIGVVNDRTFVNNGSIGAYPRMIWERNRVRRRGMPRTLASLIAGVEAWLELRFLNIRLTIDGVQHVLRSPFVFVGNGEYQVEGVNLGRRSGLADGTLSLYVARESGRLGVLSLPVRALLGTLKQYEKFETWLAPAIVLDTPKPRIAIALDGEVSVLSAPLHFSVRRAALRVLVPPDNGS